MIKILLIALILIGCEDFILETAPVPEKRTASCIEEKTLPIEGSWCRDRSLSEDTACLTFQRGEIIASDTMFYVVVMIDTYTTNEDSLFTDRLYYWANSVTFKNTGDSLYINLDGHVMGYRKARNR